MKILSSLLILMFAKNIFAGTCGYILNTSSMNPTVKHCLVTQLNKKRYFVNKDSTVILKARLYWNAPISQMVFRIQPRDKFTNRYLREAIHVEKYNPTKSFEEEGCALVSIALKQIKACN